MTNDPPADLVPWPSPYSYAMAHRCPTCKAEPGVECTAPTKKAHAERFSLSDPFDRLHATRQDVGGRHRGRDIGRAPWPEDRVPGRRYDSLGAAWAEDGSTEGEPGARP